MFLKAVTICGFKSFADRVDFTFGPGVTGIVGPNGCGKSNVVDAFKWVLGEQSARSLRGRQMIDMIFNGSSTRKSSSVAQVDLVFDNSDRSLPLDQDEIVVSRKLYRSGESEYRLNQAVSRLKDVRELFLDTGVGVDAYSVIEQGRVDGLLQSSPVERRIIFEEASGISKYKARRREAERKLERTQQNLLRVEDIVEELEKRLRSIKLQAGKARSYRQYEARLNELRSSYAMAEYHRFTVEMKRLTEEADRISDRVTTLRTEIDRQEAEGSQVTLRLDHLTDEINAADNRLVQSRSSLAAQQERIESSRKRIDEQNALLERSKERLAVDTERFGGAERELASVEASAVDLRSRVEGLQARIEELEEADRRQARSLTEAQAILEDEKAGIIDLLRRSAQAHNEIIRFNTHRESLVDQKGRLSQRDAQIASELEVRLGQRAELERRLREVEELIHEEGRKLEEKKTQMAHAGSVKQRLGDELARLKEERSALQSRRELLHDLERNMEGVGTAARRLLDQKRGEESSAEELDWIEGLVADVFETDIAHAAVIEAALGEWAQYLVISDSNRLFAYQQECGELPGRLTALCLDRLPPVINERDFSEQPGFVARALDYVRAGQPYEQLARHLFSKTIVVEDLATAVAMSAADPAGHRFLTRAGDLVQPDGRISLGVATAGTGLISRKSELRDIDAQLVSAGDRVRILTDQLNRADAEVEHLDGVLQELRTSIYELNTAKVEANAAMTSITETVKRLTHEQPLITGEVLFLERQIKEIHEKSEAGGKSLEAIERENSERERKVEGHQQRIDEIVAERSEVQGRLTQTRVEIGQLTEKESAAQDTIHVLRRSMGELEESLDSAKRDIEQCLSRLADAEQSIRAGAQQVSSLTEAVRTLETDAARLRNERETLRLDMDGRTQAVKTARQELGEAESRLHERRMSLTETKVRRDDLISRIKEELGVDLAERAEEYEAGEQDWAQVEAEITELRQKMDRLGNVNFDAINELEDLEQRHGFLTSQYDDLTESHRQLERLIQKLNSESRDRFQESFEQIREHFRGMFRKLFGGGKADIVLEDPENLLECGIEIVAQPPGKELQVISLMSGGEKSLTAIALLMSIFKNRPAPFAIMDEVDAALDEANNDRFNQIIREFVDNTQFIVITHSKWTMNIADQLYGITMPEPGVSTRVSVEFSDAHVA